MASRDVYSHTDLLNTEHMGPKGWIRQRECHLPPEEGLRGHQGALPPAGYKMVPVMDGSAKAGRFEWRRFPDGEIEDFKVNDLRADGDFSLTFSEFKQKEYPQSLLTPEKVCPRGLWVDENDMALWFHTTYLQANFIKGGLLLCMGIFHSAADATTTYVLTRVLAEEVAKAQGLPVADPVDVAVLLKEREKLQKSERAHLPADNGVTVPGKGGIVETHPEYIILPFVPDAPPPKLLAPIHQANVFHFSPSALEQLKKDSQPTPEQLRVLKDDKDLPAFVSTNDALIALVWKVVMEVQHPDLDAALQDDPARPSHVIIALDERRRAKINKHTLGNLLAWAPVFHDLRSVVRDASLADLAVLCRRTVAERTDDPDVVHKLEAMLEGVEDLNRLAPQSFLDIPGRNMLTSNWRDNDYYGLSWGPALGGSLKALRAPSVGVCHGFHIVLPDRPEKPGIEMIVGVENSAIDRLMKHPVWTKYAEEPKLL
ncbi:transferase [Apiospora saccharicola]|uniref:Transferase n=1 Tax=Apiospora saccharicola TaxID=335842 RepID=A0ABR1UGV5_9PEZI